MVVSFIPDSVRTARSTRSPPSGAAQLEHYGLLSDRPVRTIMVRQYRDHRVGCCHCQPFIVMTQLDSARSISAIAPNRSPAPSA